MSDRPTRSRGPLRRTLFGAFAALGVLGLVVVAVTLYTEVSWRSTEDSLSRHYTRSLRLQEVRALTFEAFKEVPDALLDDPNSRADYERRLQPLAAVFREWAELAEDEAERAEVETVRAAAQKLETESLRVFELAAAGQRAAADAQLERVEEEAFEPFDAVTTAAVERDRLVRNQILEETSATRRTATAVLLVAAFGVVALLLLVGAVLSGGVFRPLRQLTDALQRLAADDGSVRLSTDGDDEISAVNAAYNRVAQAALERRDQAGGERVAPALPLRLVETDASALLHQVLDRFDDELVRRAVSVRLRIDAGVPVLVVDRSLMVEALSELVRNALDALPDRGGELGLVCDGNGGQVRLEVTDDGPGISREDVSWLYDGAEPADGERGSGLHRATVIVEQHGARLQLDRRDRLTIARVLLPRS